MKNNTPQPSSAIDNTVPLESADLAQEIGEESWTYIKTVVDTVREPFLILDKELRVMAANESFYRTFQVEAKDTEKRHMYELGNGQWDIPALRKLLEDILPKNSFFKGFEVIHDFPHIGRKVMILNARRVYKEEAPRTFPAIILLAMEDITDMMVIAEKFASQANNFETKVSDRMKKLETEIDGLRRALAGFQQKL